MEGSGNRGCKEVPERGNILRRRKKIAKCCTTGVKEDWGKEIARDYGRKNFHKTYFARLDRSGRPAGGEFESGGHEDR